MSSGVLMVTLVNVSLNKAKTLSGGSTTVEIIVGSQRSYVSGKGKSFKCRETELFGCKQDYLDIYAYNEGDRSSRLVHGQINLNPIF